MLTSAMVLLVIALAYATVTDLKYRKIPNKLTFPMLAGGIVLHGFRDGQAGLVMSLSGIGLALAVMIAPFILNWVGAGDVKLTMVVGALMGADFAFTSLLYAALVAGAFAIAYIVWRRQLVATVHYLLLFWYLPAPADSALKGKLPYAPAMALGCAMAWFLATLSTFR